MTEKSTTAPRERLLRRPEVSARVGLRATAIYKRIREGGFPKGVLLSPRCVVWPESEIDAWIAAQIAAQRPSAGSGDGDHG